MKEFLDQIEESIRSGHAKGAGTKLLAVKTAKIPVTLRGRFAALSRRANLPSLALRILNPAVRPAGRKIPTATEPEIAEYCASLLRLGATQEALDLLTKLDEKFVPESLLYQAFAHFSRWKYSEAIPLLERYVSHSGLNDYQRAIGKANLVASLVHERHPSAEPAVADLIKETQARDYRLLLANAYLLSAELEVSQKRWSNAEARLESAETFLESSNSLESLFIRKWRAILFLHRQKLEDAIPVLGRVRDAAVTMKHWETLRDCDYHQAVATKNRELFLKVYFGTPYEDFRRQLLREFGETIALPRHYDWALGPSEKAPIYIHLLGADAAERKGLKAGQALHRALNILSQDFYRPVRIASLHASLYRGEYFNPNSSPGRVHQVLKRLKHWLRARRIPIEVHEENGSYCLSARHLCHLRIPADRDPIRRPEALLTLLAQRTGEEEFTAAEASKLLDINLWAAIRLMKQGKESGLLQSVGRGSRIRYRFLNAQRPSKAMAS